MSQTPYEELRRAHRREAMRLLPEHVRRLSWPAERLRRERQERLRELVSVAVERSPWHARRLDGIDAGGLVEDDLARVPPMTKADLMEHWDEIVTDRRLRLDGVEAFLAGMDGDAYLLDEYHACSSGGSSGRRGTFVFDRGAWTIVYVASIRHSVRELMSDPELAGAPRTMAVVAADRSTHITAAANQTFSTGMIETHRFPVTLPFQRILRGLEELQPTFLFGYASVLQRLALAAREGRLDIAPKRVAPTAEPLLPEVRELLETTWGAPVTNHWASTEGGMMAVGTGRGPRLALSDDLLVVEPIDREGRPVPPGTRSDKVLLTNLYNRTLPLIRYELTDEITVVDEPCPWGSGHRLIEDVHGRSDDAFRYPGDVFVHPFVFRGPLGRDPGVVEYQVRQTSSGAEVDVRCRDEVDLESLRGELAAHLEEAGLERPTLTLTPVDEIPRGAGGKVKRFVPRR